MIAEYVLGIDPGNENSAYALIRTETCFPVNYEKLPNRELHRRLLADRAPIGTEASIEMVASYGMPVGREVFETCVWIGRFAEILARTTGREPELVYRRDVKLHHCHSPRANDATIRQALVDRFAHGQPNHGKGTKKQPGWFYGFHSDIWQAYALAVAAADRLRGRWGAMSAEPQYDPDCWRCQGTGMQTLHPDEEPGCFCANRRKP